MSDRAREMGENLGDASGPGATRAQARAPRARKRSRPKVTPPIAWLPIATAPHYRPFLAVRPSTGEVVTVQRFSLPWIGDYVIVPSSGKFWRGDYWLPLPEAAAQGIEAGTAETRSGSVHESPVPEGDAPKPP